MRKIDITKINPKLAKFPIELESRKTARRIAYSTIYVNDNHVGFSSKIGIGFVRKIKAGIFFKFTKELKRTLNGRVRWYNTCATSLSESIRDVRRFYKIKIPSKGWIKIKVRHYNTTGAEEIVRFVEIALDRPDL